MKRLSEAQIDILEVAARHGYIVWNLAHQEDYDALVSAGMLKPILAGHPDNSESFFSAYEITPAGRAALEDKS